ncbi:MAG: hypothetical protein M1814_003245 [Vezdaea aestivalis]|nr:MAG: hypothetical protein M1814_003245 [Vezdaea aestivalis]
MSSQGRPHTFTQQQQNFIPNGTPAAPGNMSQTASSLPANGRIVQAGGARVLCVADVRGNLRSLNDLAKAARADHIIHTGDFGFYDDGSLERVNEKTLKHVAQYSPLLNEHVKKQIQVPGNQAPVKTRFAPSDLPLSELPDFLSKRATLDVPVYTVWGACEDVRVLEKFRSGEYKVNNLHIIDEANSRPLEIGGVKLRLLGLGGAVVMHKLFDNGEGRTTIAGGGGTMWTTLLQMGELVDTSNRVYDPAETRIFVTHASPAREGLLNQLSVTLKADFSISAGLHFRYGSSYNEFSVNPSLDHYRGKLAAAKASFNDVWETVKTEVEPAIEQNDAQKTLLSNALEIVNKMPEVANGTNPFGGPGGQVDESAFKNMWNFNLADAAFGWLVLEVEGGRIGTEMKAQGFNFAHRGSKANPSLNPALQGVPASSNGPAQPNTGQPRPTHPQQPQASRGQQQQKSQQAVSRENSSPAAVAPVTQAKPTTPQPSGQKVSLPPTEDKKPIPAQTDNSRNGAPKETALQKAHAAAKSSSPVEKSAPITALFVSNVETEQAARDVFSDEDKAKITRVEQYKNGPWIVHFKDIDEARAVLSRQSDKLRNHERVPGAISVRMFQDRSQQHFTRTHGHGDGGSAGRWGTSNRSGSDSETMRGGRGGSRGRGSYRGDRGNRGDRGGRGGGGRGGSQNTEANTTAPATTTSKTDSGPAGSNQW